MSEVKIKENSFAEGRLTGTIIYANFFQKKIFLHFLFEKKRQNTVFYVISRIILRLTHLLHCFVLSIYLNFLQLCTRAPFYSYTTHFHTSIR